MARRLAPWALLALALLPAGVGARHLSLSMIDEVRFEGAVRAEAPALRHLADVPNGVATWRIDPDEVARAVARHPWVDTAEVRRVGLSTLVIEVHEHRPVALLAQDGLQYIDDQGRVFLEARSEDLDFPVLTGLDAELGALHPELPQLVVRDAVVLLAELEKADLLAPVRISEVQFSRTRGYTVLLESGTRIVFGLGDPRVPLSRLRQLRSEGLRLDHPTLIDLAADRVALVRPLQG